MSSQMLLLLAIAAATHLILPIAVAEQPISCPDKCGDISVPFPFGMKDGCFREGFQVSCNHSYDPPRAFLAGSAAQASFRGYYKAGAGDFSDFGPTGDRFMPIEIFNMSAAESQAWSYGSITSLCSTNGTYRVFKMQFTLLDNEGLFRLSPVRNVVVGVGSNVETRMDSSLNGAMADGNTSYYQLSCLSNLMGFTQFASDGSCMGRGCCTATLPPTPPITMFAPAMKPEGNPDWNDTPCSYSMLAEVSWYNFSKRDLEGYEVLSERFARGVPFVLDFAIGNASCPADGQPPPPDYACVSGNSSCANATTGKGYVCKCWENYDGNPYIANGCQDINECDFPHLNNCSRGSICKNKPGGYDCPCKPTFRFNNQQGRCEEIFPLAAKVPVGIAAFIVVLVLAVMSHQLLKLKRFYEQNGGPILKDVKNIRIYTRKQLKHITNNYKHVIGEGHFGKVFMGTLEDKQKVAIKKSIEVDEERKKEFTDEVIIQSGMRHKNIVRLLGCCLQMDVPLLVYEFAVRGSLYDVLFKSRVNIPVDARLKIAIGSAEGLAYMHSAVESTIRHGDVKSANILLDENFTPKVSDFGTSRLLARGKAEKTDWVIGDKGYIDPVYMDQGLLTQKSDVYSFGIVLIELITRRAATYDDKRSYVTNFVQACREERVVNFVDNDITSEEDIKILEMVSQVAVHCLKPNLEARLDMKQVEHNLQIIGQSTQHAQERNYEG